MLNRNPTPSGALITDRVVPGPDSDTVRAELRNILAWEPFRRSERLSRFLRYTVEQTIENPAPQLKEYVIAVEVFDKPRTFDPRLDPIVRVEARRLRTRIREYYESEGRDHPVAIRFGPRGYKPSFEYARPEVPAPQPPVATALRGPHERHQATAIAVLPFSDLNPEGVQERLCDTLTEELINALGRTGEIRVASRTSTRQYQGQAVDIREVGRALGVDAVLEGSVRQNAERLRIVAQLYSAEDGLELWSRAYERPSSDIFAIPAAIAEAIADSLNAGLRKEGPSPAPARPPANAHAYRMFLRGLHYWRDGTDPASAVASLSRAISEEPGFAPAHSELALAHLFRVWFKEAPSAEALEKAQAAASAALKIDPFQAAAHTVIACNHALSRWDWRASEREFLRALELGPEESVAHEWYASAFLAPLLRLDDALREIERAAQAIDPRSPPIQCHAGLLHFYRGDREKARQLLLGALEAESEFGPALLSLGRVLLEEGDYGRAEEYLKRADDISNGSSIAAGHLGYCYARQGKAERARQIAAQIEERSRTQYVSPLHSARIHIGLAEMDAAIADLEAAREYRCALLAEIAADPLYKPLHNDERFLAIARSIGLPL